MIINLKQIQALDADNIKLDKINYNFDQLLVNGGGPKGFIGPVGNNSPQGFKGAQGYQGDRGVQGVQGPDDNSTNNQQYWQIVAQNTDNNIMATLFSKHTATGTPPVYLIYGAVVGAGYITGENGYILQQSNTSGLPKYQWVVNRKSNKVAGNLRFTSKGVLNNAFDITMDNSGVDSYKLYLGFINNQKSRLNLQAENHIIKDSNTGNPLFGVSASGGTVHGDTFFEKSVKFNSTLALNIADEPTGKIVTAVDNTGAVTFKTTEELGGSVKIGTIISMLPSVFRNSTNFINFQSIDASVNSINENVPLQIRIGAGIGDYAGWYLCNGQTWTNDSSPGIQVPDLNSFSYQIISNPITSNPNSQGNILLNNDEIQLIGGSDIFVNAIVPEGSLQYDTNLENNSNDPQISINGSGSGFKIKKLPQVIYLGDTDLYWSQPGEGQLSVGDYSGSDYSLSDYNAS